MNKKDMKKLNYMEQEVVKTLLSYEPITQKNMLILLKHKGIEYSDERSLRHIYEGIRQKYSEGVIAFTICSCKGGNYVSNNRTEIKLNSEKAKRTAFGILKLAYATEKRLKKTNQLSFPQWVEGLGYDG